MYICRYIYIYIYIQIYTDIQLKPRKIPHTCTFVILLGNCNCGNWTKFSPCSVTCGQGVEIWTQQCDNATDRYGKNCSKKGVHQEKRSCSMKMCSGKIFF